jgi:hypothetical protein
MKIGVFQRWGDVHFGRPEDQPLVLALLFVLIVVTLYLFF